LRRKFDVKTIKDMPEHSRPREKLREKGASALTDEELVAEIEAERALVEANRKLVELFEKKIQSKLAEIWGSGDDSRKEAQE
jgi:DNA repair protein RadC